MVSDGFNDRFPCQGDRLLQFDVGRGSPHLDDKLARTDIPLTLALMGIEAKLVCVQFHTYRLTLTRLQGHTFKSLQLDGTYLLPRSRGTQIDLCDLVGNHLTCIPHLKAHIDTFRRGGDLLVDLQVLIVEGSVGQSIAEMPLDTRVFLSRIVIADGTVNLRIGIADRQLCRGCHLTIEDVGNGIATLLTRIPCLHDGGTPLGKTGHHLCPAAEDHQHDGFTRLDERLDELLLLSRQTESLHGHGSHRTASRSRQRQRR